MAATKVFLKNSQGYAIIGAGKPPGLFQKTFNEFLHQLLRKGRQSNEDSLYSAGPMGITW